MIQSTSVERKQPLTHRARVQPRSEVKSREVNRENKHYSFELTSPIHHFPKPQKIQIHIFRSIPNSDIFLDTQIS